MPERNSWVERQQRLVRCKIHGLHYDPQLTSGCTKCRKNAQPRRRSPQLAILLLLLLAIVFVGLQLLTPLLRPAVVEAALSDVPGAADPTEVRAPAHPQRLDPEPYRPAIEAIEAALFEPQTADLTEIGAQAATAGSRLSGLLQQARGELGAEAAAALGQLAAGWQGSMVTPQDVEQARSHWLGTRTRFFEEQPWFKRALEGDGTNERLSLLVYRNLAGEVETLIAQAQGQVAAQQDGTIPLAEAPADRAARLEGERRWWTEWRQQVTVLPAQLPERPSARADAQLLTAVAELEQALARLRQLADDPSLGQSADASASLTELSSRVSTITRNLDDLLIT